MTNQNPLPHFSPEQFNTLDVLQAHAEHIIKAYTVYIESIARLRLSHDSYYGNPTLRSQALTYEAALKNYEAAQAAVNEAKDLVVETGMVEWLP